MSSENLEFCLSQQFFKKKGCVIDLTETNFQSMLLVLLNYILHVKLLYLKVMYLSMRQPNPWTYHRTLYLPVLLHLCFVKTTPQRLLSFL